MWFLQLEDEVTFSVSINPLYQCNFRCPFCYLTDDQLKSRTRLEPSVLRTRLAEISKYKTITQVDLYGGELTLLPESYVLTLLDVIHEFYQGSISVITNLSIVPRWLYRDDIDVSVSWDYTEREQHGVVLSNMVQFNKPFHVLMLASHGMVDWTDDDMNTVLTIYNTLPKLKSVEIKPYSSNQANQDTISFTDFENFIKRWIGISPLELRSYEFVNENKIKRVLAGSGYSWSDDHIYVTPQGDFAVLEFDQKGNEYFMTVYDWYDYLKWVMDEYLTVNTHAVCGWCEFRGRCLSEHLRPVMNFETESCSGFRGLLEWYRTTN